jgi:hypothetical protein
VSSSIINFRQDGIDYEYEAEPPDLKGKEVRRFTYGQEPKVIAELDLAGGQTVEIHGYAEHWTKDEVAVAWSDDKVRHCRCWVPARKVRRPADDEWHGGYVSR